MEKGEPMKPDHIERQWKTLWAAGHPGQPPEGVQHDSMRTAFYAGAQALISIMFRHLEPGSEPTPADLRLMEEIESEIQAYGRSLIEEASDG